jgi:hypothetical protein
MSTRAPVITLAAVSDPAAQEHYRVELAGQVAGHLRKHATHWTARDAHDATLPGRATDFLFTERDGALHALLASLITEAR